MHQFSFSAIIYFRYDFYYPKCASSPLHFLIHFKMHNHFKLDKKWQNSFWYKKKKSYKTGGNKCQNLDSFRGKEINFYLPYIIFTPLPIFCTLFPYFSIFYFIQILSPPLTTHIILFLFINFGLIFFSPFQFVIFQLLIYVSLPLLS